MEHCVHRISRACQPKNVDVYDADLYDTVEAMAAPKTADQKKKSCSTSPTPARDMARELLDTGIPSN
jgi:hypothetical protein